MSIEINVNNLLDMMSTAIKPGSEIWSNSSAGQIKEQIKTLINQIPTTELEYFINNGTNYWNNSIYSLATLLNNNIKKMGDDNYNVSTSYGTTTKDLKENVSAGKNFFSKSNELVFPGNTNFENIINNSGAGLDWRIKTNSNLVQPTNQLTSLIQPILKYIELLMPKNTRRVEVLDLNRNFWVINATCSILIDFLFREDNVFKPIFQNILNELLQMWENVLFLWVTECINALNTRKILHSEFIYLNENNLQPYRKFDEQTSSSTTSSAGIIAQLLEPYKNKYYNQFLILIPLIRADFYQEDLFKTLKIPYIFIKKPKDTNFSYINLQVQAVASGLNYLSSNITQLKSSEYFSLAISNNKDGLYMDPYNDDAINNTNNKKNWYGYINNKNNYGTPPKYICFPITTALRIDHDESYRLKPLMIGNSMMEVEPKTYYSAIRTILNPNIKFTLDPTTEELYLENFCLIFTNPGNGKATLFGDGYLGVVYPQGCEISQQTTGSAEDMKYPKLTNSRINLSNFIGGTIPLVFQYNRVYVSETPNNFYLPEAFDAHSKKGLYSYNLGECASDRVTTQELLYNFSSESVNLIPFVSLGDPSFQRFSSSYEVVNSTFSVNYDMRQKFGIFASSVMNLVNNDENFKEYEGVLVGDAFNDIDSTTDFNKIAIILSKMEPTLMDQESVQYQVQLWHNSSNSLNDNDSKLYVGTHPARLNHTGTDPKEFSWVDTITQNNKKVNGSITLKLKEDGEEYYSNNATHVYHGAALYNPMEKRTVVFKDYYSISLSLHGTAHTRGVSGNTITSNWSNSYSIFYTPYKNGRIKDLNKCVLKLVQISGGRTFVQENINIVPCLRKSNGQQFTISQLDEKLRESLEKTASLFPHTRCLKVCYIDDKGMVSAANREEGDTTVYSDYETDLDCSYAYKDDSNSPYEFTGAFHVCVNVVTVHYFSLNGGYARKIFVRQKIDEDGIEKESEKRYSDKWRVFYLNKDRFEYFEDKVKHMYIKSDNRYSKLKGLMEGGTKVRKELGRYLNFDLCPSNGLYPVSDEEEFIEI